MSLQRKLLRNQVRAARKVFPPRWHELTNGMSDGWFDERLDAEPGCCPCCGAELVLVYPEEYLV